MILFTLDFWIAFDVKCVRSLEGSHIVGVSGSGQMLLESLFVP